MVDFAGDIPTMQVQTEQRGLQPVLKSSRDKALLESVMLGPGYGPLNSGCLLAKNLSAGGNAGKYVPYVPDSVTAAVLGTDKYVGATALLETPGASGTSVTVSIDDSYRFVVGDDLIIAYGTNRTNGGAITAIDRTTYSNKAVITFTTAFSGTGASYTPAAGAHCYVEAGSSGKLSKALYVLEKMVDTGRGASAAGGQASIIVNNATLYKYVMQNYDTQVLTDISRMEAFGTQFLFLF